MSRGGRITGSSRLTVTCAFRWNARAWDCRKRCSCSRVVAPDAFIVALLAPFGPSLRLGVPRAQRRFGSDVRGSKSAAVGCANRNRAAARRSRLRGRAVVFPALARFHVLITTAYRHCGGSAGVAVGLRVHAQRGRRVRCRAAAAAHMATLPIKGWAMVSIAPIRASGDTRFSMTVSIDHESVSCFPPRSFVSTCCTSASGACPVAWIFAWTARAVLTAFKLRDGSWTRRTLLAR